MTLKGNKNMIKTRPVLELFFTLGFLFYGCAKGFYDYVIQSSNQQKLIEETRLSNCDVRLG